MSAAGICQYWGTGPMPWDLRMADTVPCVCDFDFDQYPVLPQADTLHMAFRRLTMYQRILVPIDGSATSQLGLEEAMRLAQLTHGRLRLIHVVDELSFAYAVDSYGYYAGELLDLLKKDGVEILEKGQAAVKARGIPVDTVLYENLAKTVQQRVIEEVEAWKADLIVIGTHGRRGVRRMVLGSSAEAILREATVPVLMVRPPKEVS